MTDDALIAELRRTYDLLPGRAACDILAGQPAIANWLIQYVDTSDTYYSVDTAAATDGLSRTYLSGGERVLARVVLNLLDPALPFDLHQLWRLGTNNVTAVFAAIVTNHGV